MVTSVLLAGELTALNLEYVCGGGGEIQEFPWKDFSLPF